MPRLSQDTIRELGQSLPLLKRLWQTFVTHPTTELFFIEPTTVNIHHELEQLRNAYDRISELTSSREIKAWVGQPFDTAQIAERGWEHVILSARGLSERLYLYVQGIVENARLEETLNRLAKENTSLKQQLAELHHRESAYLSIIQEAQTSATYLLPQESREILLDSLQRQHVTLTKNLARLQETKAQYGLSTPLDILNAIDQTQEDLKRIEASIADLKAGSTATN
jgi:chromosome segregation ATPase